MSSGLEKTILQGTVKDNRRITSQKKRLLKNGQGCTLAAQLEKLKTGLDGKGFVVKSFVVR